MSCELAERDGAYVLGSLSPAERKEFEQHLARCKECARNVRELAGLPGLLARVDRAVLEDPDVVEPVPDTLLPALVRDVRREGRRHTLVTAGLAAAAAVVVVGVPLGVSGVLEGDRTPSAPVAPASPVAQRMVPVGDVPVRASLAFASVTWGTRLDLTCTYGDSDWNDPRWSTYTMYVQTADGSVERVASWKVVPGKELHIEAATASDVKDISDVQVRTASGATVLELS